MGVVQQTLQRDQSVVRHEFPFDSAMLPSTALFLEPGEILGCTAGVRYDVILFVGMFGDDGVVDDATAWEKDDGKGG